MDRKGVLQKFATDASSGTPVATKPYVLVFFSFCGVSSHKFNCASISAFGNKIWKRRWRFSFFISALSYCHFECVSLAAIGAGKSSTSCIECACLSEGLLHGSTVSPGRAERALPVARLPLTHTVLSIAFNISKNSWRTSG